MKVFLAYFDMLGFKDFINNNDHGTVSGVFQDIITVHVQNAMTNQKTTFIDNDPRKGAIPDFDYARVNCLQISDSIIFWKDVILPIFRTRIVYY